MKILSVFAAVVLTAGMAWALQGKPINDTCPVKGQPIKGVTSTYKGKTIGFCWGGCKGQFDSNPEKFIANIPALAPPPVRTASITSAADGVKAGKDDSKPVLILFMDATPKSKQWTESLGDKSLDDVFSKIVYVAVDFKKDGDDEKKYSVTSAPTLVLVDASKDEPKGKKLSSPAPASIKKELEAAIKATTKK